MGASSDPASFDAPLLSQDLPGQQQQWQHQQAPTMGAPVVHVDPSRLEHGTGERRMCLAHDEFTRVEPHTCKYVMDKWHGYVMAPFVLLPLRNHHSCCVRRKPRV